MKYVYFIRPVGMDGPVKIGHSDRPTSRLDTLMSWSPFPLEIAATVEGGLDIERRFHGMFAEDHTHREWFRASPLLTNVIGRLQVGAVLDDVLDPRAKPADFRNYSCRRAPEKRRLMSYMGRLWHAFGKRGNVEPDDVRHIMGRWRFVYGMPVSQPTDAEIARLEEVLASPAKHGISREKYLRRYYPKTA